MSSFERLDALREQNKGLLAQLSDIRTKLRLNLGSFRVGETLLSDVAVNTLHEFRPEIGVDETGAVTLNDKPAVVPVSGCGRTESFASTDSLSVVTLPGGRLGQARVALSRPRTPLKPMSNVDQVEAVDPETDILRSATPPLQFESLDTHSMGSPTYTGLLQDLGNQRIGQTKQGGTEGHQSSHHCLDREQSELGQVTFQDQDQNQDEERRRLRPLLGYDWIAGLLDTETSLTEHSEQFFTELRNFRQVNWEECVHSLNAGIGEDELSPPTEETKAQLPEEMHQCTFCYRINSRLFPGPLDPQTACPVCKVPKAHNPNSGPAFIRVSIPRSALLPPHNYRPHRRLGFDPFDSLGLPSHCMSGWSSAAPAEAPQFSSLDLRSSLKTGRSRAVPTAQAKQLSRAPSKQQLDVPFSQVRMDQRSEELIDLTRLAGFRFPRLAPKPFKPQKTAYPVY